MCITAVCPFSKWVEAAPLADKSSQGTTHWLHSQIVCRFGVPWGLRVDQGTEFKGAFREYCAHLGIQLLPIFTSHPQANGLIERYNGVIRAGLRMTQTPDPTTPWTERLPGHSSRPPLPTNQARAATHKGGIQTGS